MPVKVKPESVRQRVEQLRRVDSQRDQAACEATCAATSCWAVSAMIGPYPDLVQIPMPLTVRLRAAAKAGSLHLMASIAVAVATASVTFGLWYPAPFGDLSKGRDLFWLIVSADVICGPLLTLVLFNPAKPRSALVRDLALVVFIQLGALGYGVWTLFHARPVHLVFEVDRFRVVSVADIDPSQLGKAPIELQQLPWTGPTLIGARRSKTQQELLQSIESALGGVDIAMQPARWVAFDTVRPDVIAKSVPLAEFIRRKPDALAALETAVRQAGRPIQDLRALPVVSRFSSWTALIDETGEPVAFAAVDTY